MPRSLKLERRAAAAETTPQASPASSLTVTTWNLGYSGLGRESDSVFDGGRGRLPPSRAAVDKNQEIIASYLTAEAADIILLQEVAKPGPMTLWRDLLGAVDGASPRAERWFHADLRAWTPPPLRVVHGLATLSQLTAASATATRLPTDGRALLRLGGALGLRRRYAVLELDLPFEDGAGGGLATGWTVINLHLSAFDADARLRAAQVNALFDRAEAAHAAGRAVVLGGDWNLALTETAFPQGAAPTRCGEWLRPFPAALAPDGWSLVYDSATATVRAANQPYVEGENMRAVIDGFVVSPNVAVERCETVDLFFEASDHNPVRGRFRLCAP